MLLSVRISCFSLPVLALAMLQTEKIYAQETCFEFFQSADGTVSCADFSFFGFNGETTALVDGIGTGGIDADVDGTVDGLDFLQFQNSVFADVEVHNVADPVDPTVSTEFSIAHRGRVEITPLENMPPVGADSQRFMSTGSESKVLFQVTKPGATSDMMLPIEIGLMQDLTMIDSPNNTTDGEAGTFFFVTLADAGTGEILHETVGSSKLDTATAPNPIVTDPFAPGYEGFSTFMPGNDGSIQFHFDRTDSHQARPNETYELDTLVSQSVSTDGFGGMVPIVVDNGNTFTFRISSPDPEVRFIIDAEFPSEQPEVTTPSVKISQPAPSLIRLSWTAEDSQSYNVFFSEDPDRPLSQWQNLATVSGQSGEISRDFPRTDNMGFYVLEAMTTE